MQPNKKSIYEYGFQASQKQSISKFPSSHDNRFLDYQFPTYSNMQIISPKSASSEQLISRVRTIQGRYKANDQGLIYSQNNNNNPTYRPQPTADNYLYKKQMLPVYFNNPGPNFKIQNSKIQKTNIIPFPNIRTEQILQTAPSTTQILPKVQKFREERLLDFLYKIFGILSCHIRLKQRFALYRLFQTLQQEKSVKNITEFHGIVDVLFRRKRQQNLLAVFENLKFNNQQYKNYYMQNQVQKKSTQINLLSQSNFAMQQSDVQKGIKRLEQFSKKRQNQQKKRFHLNQHQKQSKDAKQKKGQKYDQIDPYFYNRNALVSPKKIDNFQSLKFNSKMGKKNQNIQQAKNQFQPSVYKSGTQKSLVNQNRKQYEYKSKLQQWKGISLNDVPLILTNKQIFDRLQISQRKHYLNPNILVGSEPDINDFIMPLQHNQDYQSHGISTQLDIYKKLTQRTTQANLPEDNIPLFDPNNIYNSRNKNCQSTPHLAKNFGNQSSVKIENAPSNRNQATQQQFDNLPSFALKNIFMRNNKQAQIKKEELNTLSDQLKKKGVFKEQQNSFNISEGQVELQQHHDLLMDSGRKKIHKIQEYFTDNNLKSSKNKGSSRVSIQFSKNTKNKNKDKARPKSMTNSWQKRQQTQANNLMYKSIQHNQHDFKDSQEIQKPLANNVPQASGLVNANFTKRKIITNENTSQQTKPISPSANIAPSPVVQSPSYQTQVSFSNKKFFVSNQNARGFQPIPQQQQKPASIFFQVPLAHNSNQPYNRPFRSISSQARFIYPFSDPRNIIHQHKQINSPSYLQQIMNHNIIPAMRPGIHERISQEYQHFANKPQQIYENNNNPMQMPHRTNQRHPANSLYTSNSPPVITSRQKRKGIQVKSIQKSLTNSKSQKQLQSSSKKNIGHKQTKRITSQYS